MGYCFGSYPGRANVTSPRRGDAGRQWSPVRRNFFGGGADPDHRPPPFLLSNATDLAGTVLVDFYGMFGGNRRGGGAANSPQISPKHREDARQPNHGSERVPGTIEGLYRRFSSPHGHRKDPAARLCVGKIRGSMGPGEMRSGLVFFASQILFSPPEAAPPGSLGLSVTT